jgi:hypothetical protein
MTVIRNSVLSSAKPSSPHQSRLRMVAPSDDSVNRVLERAFAPLHKRALGVAVGATVAMVVFAVTVFHIIARPIDIPIDLVSQYFYGYDTTWRGALIGVWWGFISGFVAGWFLAFLRNFMVATWIFVVRTKASLAQTQDFLDHI